MTAEARAVWSVCEVVETRPVAEGVQRLTVRRPASRRAAPGTHVDVRLPTPDGDLVRSYSIVESSADGSLLTVSVMLAPASRGGSRAMHALEVGDELRCTQPLQNFELRHGAPRYLVLAGGIGVTALVETARVLRASGQDYRFVYVGRRREQMAYLRELEDLHGERLEVHVDEEGTGLDVDALVADLAGPGRTEAYVCGPIRLMDAVRRSWVAHDRALPDLRFETFGSSGWFAPEEFTVDVPELGLSTVVGPASTLLEALVGAGADLMYDCRKGECGLCEVRVGSLRGRIDHRDVFLSAAEQGRDASLCICVSRIAAPEGEPPGSGRVTLRL